MPNSSRIQVLPKWTPEKKRAYARERYRRLKARRSEQKPASRSKRSHRNNRKHPESLPPPDWTARLPDSTKIPLTGNAFVDTGLAVIAARSGFDSADQLTLGDIRGVHKDGRWLARDVHSLKSFTMIFTRNALLTQHRKNDSSMIESRIKMHAAMTSELLNSIGSETENEYCESCGNAKSLNLSDTVNRALDSFGVELKERFVGRDWFPLSGSLGSDAQALPSASKAASLCAKCLFAVQYLPLGVRLFGTELAVFQSTSTELWYELVRAIALEVRRRVALGKVEIVGSKEGRGGLVVQLLSTFANMQTGKKHFGLGDPRLYAWRFTNSTSPNIEIDLIPTYALRFLWDASFRQGLSSEIESILKKERTREDSTIFARIIQRSEYYGLYPGKLGTERNYEGASHELFCLYQTEILGRSIKGLKAAFEIAKSGIQYFQAKAESESKRKGKTRPKELERLTRREAFRDLRTRSTFRKIMVDMVAEGKFDLRTYLEIFPYTSDRAVSVSMSGWDLIRYYVGKIVRGSPVEFEPLPEILPTGTSQTFEMVSFLAFAVFERYTRERGSDRFKHDVLQRLERGKLDARWLGSQYTLLARESDGFWYRDWSRLCYNEDLRWTFYELLFQFRLLWSEWVNQSHSPELKNPFERLVRIEDLIGSSGLPEKISRTLLAVFSSYIESRGIDRAKEDILERLQSGELGVGWLRGKLVQNDPTKLTEEELNEFLQDPYGNVPISEKIFQMILFLNNLYRVMKNAQAAVQITSR